MLGEGRRALRVRSWRFALVRREETSCGFDRLLFCSLERRSVRVEVDMLACCDCAVSFDVDDSLERGSS